MGSLWAYTGTIGCIVLRIQLVLKSVVLSAVAISVGHEKSILGWPGVRTHRRKQYCTHQVRCNDIMGVVASNPNADDLGFHTVQSVSSLNPIRPIENSLKKQKPCTKV